jgi:hypothetical protein
MSELRCSHSENSSVTRESSRMNADSSRLLNEWQPASSKAQSSGAKERVISEE